MSNGVDFRKLALDLRGQLTTAQSELARVQKVSDNYFTLYSDSARELAALREELAKSQALSVSNILMAVTPGESGTGYEHYAESVREVEGVIGGFADQVEELQEKLSASNLNYALLYKRLTAAEQRNAAFQDAAIEVISNLGEHCCGLKSQYEADYITGQLDKLAALIKPTESGASE